MKKKIIFASIGALVLLIILSLIFGYNSLVENEEEIEHTQSQVINRLNERQDLMGQLIPTVVGLQEHAEEIYNNITSARAAYASAKNAEDIAGMIEADALEVLALNQLLVVVEDNPNITATSGFLTLMDSISAIESSLSQARKDYNDSVSLYNKAVRKFPKVLYASLFGFEKNKPYWKMNDGAEDIPKINFNSSN